jgi:elongator complex protein 5
VAVYHTDVPALPTTASSSAIPEYNPHPLTLLTHLATTIFRVSSSHHAILSRRAQERSLPEPEWGLREGREGVLVGLKDNQQVGEGMGEEGGGGVVVEMEMRRRSGRAVVERFVLTTGLQNGKRGVVVMGDHPAFRKKGGDEGREGNGEEEMEATFNLGLTEKQRRDREGVVLPYFDAQVEVGGGEGGRILYEMGREDDFDEEEDEI